MFSALYMLSPIRPSNDRVTTWLLHCSSCTGCRSTTLYRITYKLCLIMHLVHTKRAPQYLSDSVQTFARSSSRPGLKSSYTAVYAKPRCRTKSGERGLSHAGPTAWNSLPHHLHLISDTGPFQHRLKTELFRTAYVASSCWRSWLLRKQRYRNDCIIIIIIIIIIIS